MVCPQVQHTIDGLCLYGDIGADTHHFLINHEPQIDEIFDRADAFAPRYQQKFCVTDHFQRLHDLGLRLEQHYVSSRGNNVRQDRLLSYRGLRSMVSVMADLTSHWADQITEAGLYGVSPRTLAFLERKSSMRGRLNVMRRTARRASHVFSDCSQRDLDRVRNSVENQIRFSVPGLTRGHLKKLERKKRRATRLSLDFLRNFWSDDQIRLLLARNPVNMTGRDAIFEIKLCGGLGSSHGAAFSVHDRATGSFLCKLCIYTPEVPVLDHVASLALHIQAGLDQEVLRSGNAFAVAPQAYDVPWLEPFLPERREVHRLDFDDPCEDPDRIDQVGDLVRGLIMEDMPGLDGAALRDRETIFLPRFPLSSVSIVSTTDVTDLQVEQTRCGISALFANEILDPFGPMFDRFQICFGALNNMIPQDHLTIS